MITYKDFTPENMLEFLKNEKLVLDVYKIINQNLIGIQPLRDRDVINFKKDFKKNNRYLFVAFSNEKPVGVVSGYTNSGVFNIQNVFVHPKYQDKGLGKKIKIRALSYLFSKKNIERFVGLVVLNNKIYSVNQAIAARKNKSSTREYLLEVKPAPNNIYLDKNKKIKPKTNIVIKRKGKK